MNAGMLAPGMVLVFAPIGLAAYAMVCVAKWLVAQERAIGARSDTDDTLLAAPNICIPEA